MSLEVSSVEWLAGLWEAEGSFWCVTSTNSGRGRMSMTDFDVVYHAQKIVDLGRIYDMKREPPRQDQKAWVVYRKAEVQELMDALYPYLFSRRANKISELSMKSYTYTKPQISIEWLAGWLEGEGCFYAKGNCHAMTVASTDYDVIEAARDFIGYGNILSVRKAQPHHKQSYTLSLYGVNARNLMDKIYPMMGERRQAKIRQIYPGVVQ